MAKTKLSDLGSSVCVDDQNEKLVPALGNGTTIPGDLCNIDPTNGRVVGTDSGDEQHFSGILMESKITGTEAAPATDIPCMLVVPKSGHNYRIRTIDLNEDWKVGQGMQPSGTAGKMETWTHFGNIARLALPYKDNDTVAEITWA